MASGALLADAVAMEATLRAAEPAELLGARELSVAAWISATLRALAAELQSMRWGATAW